MTHKQGLFVRCVLCANGWRSSRSGAIEVACCDDRTMVKGYGLCQKGGMMAIEGVSCVWP